MRRSRRAWLQYIKYIEEWLIELSELEVGVKVDDNESRDAISGENNKFFYTTKAVALYLAQLPNLME